MKRAIVWFCWGERFINEAIDSARSAVSIAADRILITDAPGAQYAEDNPAFTSIVRTQLIHGNNLEKSRLIDLLPAGYDTFLYLDTDTKIIGDVSLGFAKAEQHGIAMAPAPNYNLAEFFNFARLMRELGTEPADQIMYNKVARRGEVRMPNANIADRVFAQATIIVERREHIRHDAALLQRQCQERLVARKIVLGADGRA